MVAEVLGRSFLSLASLGYIKGIKVATSQPLEVIQKYLDDTFLFGCSSVVEVKCWEWLLDDYASISGQQISYDKRKDIFFQCSHWPTMKNNYCDLVSIDGFFWHLPCSHLYSEASLYPTTKYYLWENAQEMIALLLHLEIFHRIASIVRWKVCFDALSWRPIPWHAWAFPFLKSNQPSLCLKSSYPHISYSIQCN